MSKLLNTIRRKLRKLVGPNRSLADELVQERRAEAAAELEREAGLAKTSRHEFVRLSDGLSSIKAEVPVIAGTPPSDDIEV